MRHPSKAMVIAVLFVVLLLAACGNKQYKEAMENGESSVDAEKYKEAIDYFEEALNEKETDETANTYLKQTELFVEGLEWKEKDLSLAKEAFTEVKETEEGLTILEERATNYIETINELEIKHGEIEESFGEVKDQTEAGKYKAALETLEKTTDQDLEHPYFSQLKKDRNDLKSEIEGYQKEKKQANEALKKAKSLAKKEDYQAAIKVIDEELEGSLEHVGLQEIKGKLNQQKKDLQKQLDIQIAEAKKAQAEKEKQAKEEKLKNDLIGYWAEVIADEQTPGRAVMKFSSDEYIWGMMNSDVMEYAKINNLRADVDKNQLIGQIEGGHEIVITLKDDNQITLGSLTYKKINENEMEKIIGDGRSAGEFFEFIKEVANTDF